jgi:hypothetical protein
MTITEQEFDAAPFSRDIVLSPAWLSEALKRGGYPTTVKAVELVEEIGYSAISLRLKATYAAPIPAGLQEELCIKGLFGALHKEYTENGVMIAEAKFYDLCAPEIGMFTPRTFYNGYSEETRNGVMIMEDLCARGVKFYNGLHEFTAANVAQSLSELARLHAWSWHVAEDTHPWVRNQLFSFANQGALQERMITMMQGERSEDLPAGYRDGKRLAAAMGALAERHKDLPRNFLHGDTHSGNVFDIGGTLGFLDWQIFQRGNWSRDVAYHISALLPVEVRRANEVELLKGYLAKLAEFGGKPPSWEEAWTQYREAMPYGFYLWAVTQRVPAPIIRANVKRLGTAAADHGAYEMLGV